MDPSVYFADPSKVCPKEKKEKKTRCGGCGAPNFGSELLALVLSILFVLSVTPFGCCVFFVLAVYLLPLPLFLKDTQNPAGGLFFVAVPLVLAAVKTQARDRPVAFDPWLGLAVESCVDASHGPRDLWQALNA